jgi:hypothetical protein
MSRGYGGLQQEILARLQDSASRAEASLASAGRVCWDIAEAHGKVNVGAEIGTSGIRQGLLNTAHYKSFRRALAALERDAALVVTRRKLESFEEIAQHFQFKSKRLEIKELRRIIFAELAKHADEVRGVFQSTEVERRLVFAMHAQRPDDSAACRQEWASVERRLWALGDDADKRPLVLPLVQKGHAYFSGGRLSETVPQSLAALLRDCREILEPALVEDLRRIYVRAFPPSQKRQVITKGRLFELADFGRNHKKVTLNDDALKMILERLPQLVRSLPGFVEPPSRRDSGMAGKHWIIVSGWTFPPLLVQAVDRHIFEDVEFLALPS